MHADSARAAIRAVLHRSAVAVLAALFAGCSGPQVVKGAGANVGMHLFVRAPPAVTALAPDAQKEFVVYRELVSFDRNQAGRVVKGVTTQDELRRLLGNPGSTTKKNGVEVWSYSNVRPGGIEIDLFEFDGQGIARKTYQIDTKTK